MATVAELMVRIGGDISDLEKSLSRASRRMQDAGKQMTAVGKTITTRVTAPLAALGGVAVAAFGKQEKAEMQLRAALQANGREVDSLFAKYDAFAKQMQATTVQGDEVTLKMLAQAEALGLTGEAAQRAVKNSIAMQSAFDVNSQSALRYTAALEQGNSTMLARYIPALRELDDETERVAMAQDILSRAFSAAESEAGTTVGAFQQMKNAVGDLMEQFGAIIADAILPFVKRIKQMAEDFQALDDRTKKMIVTISLVAASIGPVILVIGKLITALGVLMSPIGLVIAGITVLAGLATFVVKNWEAFKDSFLFLWIGIKNGVIEAIATMVESLNSFISRIPGMGGVFAGLAEKIRSFKSEIPNKEDTAQFQTFGEFMTDVGGDIGNMFEWLSGKIFGVNQQLGNTAIAARRVREELVRLPGPTVEMSRSLEDMAVTGAESGSILEIATRGMNNSFENLANTAHSVQMAFESAFLSLVNQGTTSLKELAKVAVNTARQIIAAEIAKGIAATVRSALTNVPFPFNIAAAAGAGAAAAGLFNSIVPKLAQGGLAFGPTLAVVGDNPGARSDPEVIAPLSKLQGMMGGGKVRVEGSIRGDVIHLSNIRGANKFR